MTKIYVLEGPLRGKTFEVTELASIGRGEACAVRLDGHHISRIHARLEKSGDAMRRWRGDWNGTRKRTGWEFIAIRKLIFERSRRS